MPRPLLTQQQPAVRMCTFALQKVEAAPLPVLLVLLLVGCCTAVPVLRRNKPMRTSQQLMALRLIAAA